MFIYRFKMNFEEQDGFSRDIDLLTDQTFLDFHNLINENLSLDKSLECTFYLCDHRYRKRNRIYQPGATPSPIRHNGESQEKENEKIYFMDECVLSDFIDDPHQKFIYVYDINKDWTFYIELMRIMPAAKNEKYPRIAAALGGIPSEINRKPVPLPGLSPEDEEDLEPMDDEPTDSDIEMEMEIDLNMDMDGMEIGEGEETPSRVGVSFGEGEDVDDFDDSEFFDGSIEMGEDFDEGKF